MHILINFINFKINNYINLNKSEICETGIVKMLRGQCIRFKFQSGNCGNFELVLFFFIYFCFSVLSTVLSAFSSLLFSVDVTSAWEILRCIQLYSSLFSYNKIILLWITRNLVASTRVYPSPSLFFLIFMLLLELFD
jgi:hypothetical protein